MTFGCLLKIMCQYQVLPDQTRDMELADVFMHIEANRQQENRIMRLLDGMLTQKFLPWVNYHSRQTVKFEEFTYFYNKPQSMRPVYNSVKETVEEHKKLWQQKEN